MKKLFTFIMLSIFTVLTANAQDTYVVAGVSSMMGSHWNGTDEANQMTSDDGVNYTLVKEGVKLEAGIGYDYKIVKNSDGWFPNDNQKVTVSETGIYTITFKYTVGEALPTATTQKTGNAEATKHTYGVVGTLVGSWDNDVEMTESPEGTWTAVIKDVAAKEYEYEFKVRADKSWDIAYPAAGNYLVTVAEDNTTVTIVFTESDKDIQVTQTVSTGINSLRAADASVKGYNLGGVKANKGLVIKNQKKYVVK